MAAMKPLPDLDLLRRTYRYDPETGELWFLDELPHMPRKISTRYAGKIAGDTRGGRRSCSLTYDGVNYRLRGYRIAWALFYGQDPYPFEIDHIDGNPSNDRIANLRLATSSENRRNSVVLKTTRTGVRGVYPHDGGYQVMIKHNRKMAYVGWFKDIEAADQAFKAAAAAFHGPFAKHLSAQMGS